MKLLRHVVCIATIPFNSNGLLSGYSMHECISICECELLTEVCSKSSVWGMQQTCTVYRIPDERLWVLKLGIDKL